MSENAMQARAHPGVSLRDPEEDFFCLRFQVWYSSLDCAIRTKFETCEGCRDCPQGRFNLKRHAAALAGVHPPSWLRP